MKQFKEDYNKHGPDNLTVQISHLSKLAEFYEIQFSRTQNWIDALKVSEYYKHSK